MNRGAGESALSTRTNDCNDGADVEAKRGGGSTDIESIENNGGGSAEVCITEEGMSGVGSAEVCITEEGISGVGSAEVCITEEGMSGVGSTEVCITEEGMSGVGSEGCKDNNGVGEV